MAEETYYGQGRPKVHDDGVTSRAVVVASFGADIEHRGVVGQAANLIKMEFRDDFVILIIDDQRMGVGAMEESEEVHMKLHDGFFYGWISDKFCFHAENDGISGFCASLIFSVLSSHTLGAGRVGTGGGRFDVHGIGSGKHHCR